MTETPIAARAIQWLAPGDPPLAALARRVALDARDQLPDLSRVAVLVPDLAIAPNLRRRLLGHCETGALLGPTLTTLRHWIESRTLARSPLLNTHGRELMLVEVLEANRALFGDGNPWHIADELLTLFDQLTLGEHALTRLREWQTEPGRDYLGAFAAQAEIVRTLWQAWQAQLEDEQLGDRTAWYADGLATADIPADERLYLAGYDWLTPVELSWVVRQLDAGRLHLLLSPDDPLASQLHQASVVNRLPETPTPPAPVAVLRAAFARDTLMADRARRWRGSASPLRDHVRVFSSQSPEQEAQAIDIQTRAWLLDGCDTVAIVTEDRRLARRVSALLRRAGIDAHDDAGWPLSTTAAAGALERWLEAVETDFGQRALLDVLKSSFLRHAAVTPKAVLALQRDLVEREGATRSLAAYRRAVLARAETLGGTSAHYANRLTQLLDHLETAAAPLLPLRAGGAFQPLRFLDALAESLRRLGLWDGYTLDPAGQRIQQELDEMRAGLTGRTLRMDWSACRTWLGRALETHNFRPARGASPVRILNLQQSRLSDCDGVIIAGADARHLPGAAPRLAFFNQGVREALGLKTWAVQRQQRFNQFLALLETTPRALLTHAEESEGRPLQPSPWLALLRTFHDLAFGDDLNHPSLRDWVRDPRAQVRCPRPAPLPTPPRPPAPTLPATLLPREISANAHQLLLDCPYRFFAARGLGLKAREPVAEMLDKRGYGQLIHRALEAFHIGVADLPGPFTEPLDGATRDAAIALLEHISAQVFNPALASAFQHRAWWQGWRGVIPLYIDWQIGRAAQWRVTAGEQKIARDLGNGFSISGRFDRLDSGDAGRSLIDYKTGGMPERKDMLAAEAVQLLTYALIVVDVTEVLYLPLKVSDESLKSIALGATELDALLPAVKQRLIRMLDAIAQGHGLPANGVDRVCAYCDMDGLCRREAWLGDAAAIPASTPG
ncbi:MAG: PD-(D/E)XK nuclease family protein [Thiotrichales bacterium]